MCDISLWISTAATVSIGVFAFLNYRLANNLKASNEQTQHKISDTLQALTILSFLRNMDSSIDQKKTTFEHHYTGETEIFKKWKDC